MLKVETLQLLRRRAQELVAPQPPDEVRVLVEAVRIEELIQDNTLRRQPMIRVVLVIPVTVAVDSDALSSEQVVLLLNKESSHERLSRDESVDGRLRQGLDRSQYLSH